MWNLQEKAVCVFFESERSKAVRRVRPTVPMIPQVVLLAVFWLNAATGTLRAQTPDPNIIEHERSWATVSGPARDIRFEPMTRAEGAPTDTFYQVLQDRRGFLWFTTRKGLVRYDRYQHVTYPGLPMGRMRKVLAEPGRLYEDRNGNLWVGTDVLSRFDQATGAFTPVVRPRAGPDGSIARRSRPLTRGPGERYG
jgi:hypothetical protein